MINIIWALLIFSGIILAGYSGKPDIVTQSAFSAAGAAVKYSLELAGIMSFWLGVMKITEEAGLIKSLARLMKPLTRALLPGVPVEHPAMGAILMNLSANILGLGNAATPFGLKAMQELQNLNNDKETASEPMCTFLALNTGCITFMPTMIIGLRFAAGSKNPAEIVGTTLFATAIGMSVAVLSDKIFRKIYKRVER